MQNLFITIFLFFLPSVFFNGCSALGEGTLTSGWTPITNVTDLAVVDIGKFDVDEHDKKEKVTLKFVEVVSGETKVVAGIDYNLTIKADISGFPNNYLAFVWVKPEQKFMQLMSFNGPISE